METWLVIALGVLGTIVLLVLCLLAICLPSPTQYRLSKRIINKKTGKPLSNNNVKFPLGDLTESLKDFAKGEGRRLQYVPEGACGWWALNNYDVQLTNADWLKELVTAPDIRFNRSFASFKTLHRLLGTSLLGCQGEDWNRMHKILYKAFSPANLSAFVPVFVRQARELANLLDTAASTRSTQEMVLEFNNLALGVMVDAGFGNAINAEEKQTIVHAFRYLFNETQNPLHDIPVLCKLPFPSNLECERQFAKLYETADRIVALRRAAHESGSITDTHEGKVMIDLLLDARDSEHGELGLSDLELRDNIVMLLVAGSETTASTLSWTLWHIVNITEVREAVMREIESLDISWDHFNVTNFDTDMPVLTNVIKESLRVTPAISGIPERIYREASTLGDLELPAGSRVGVAQYVMHRNPDYWTDPDTFDPSRFTAENVKARHPYAYLPFGVGRRTCMGKTFAMNEIRVVLALLFKYYDFQYDIKNGPVQLLWRPPSVTPRNGLPMFITRRT